MKRDPTVLLSLFLIMSALAIDIPIGTPREVREDPVSRVLFWIILIGSIRAAVLWFQTLIHGIKHAKEENRVAVVLGHVILGPIMAYGYYLSSREDAKQAAKQQQQVMSNEGEGRKGVWPL